MGVKGGFLSTRQVKNIFLFALFVFSLVSNGHCETSSTNKIKVTTTTSLLGSIVQAIGKQRIDVITIVPAGMCPGHFDIKAEDIKNLANSKVLLNHGWEKWIDKLLGAVDNKPVLFTINIEENLMVPQIHKKAAGYITALLCSLDQAHREYYLNNFASYTSIIDSLETRIKKGTEKLIGTKVVCSKLQVEFLEWLGFDIVMTYTRGEELTPRVLSKIIREAKKEKVKLVVDNLQSGHDIGLNIAQEIGAQHISLTNFPLKGSYPDALIENFNTIIQALR